MFAKQVHLQDRLQDVPDKNSTFKNMLFPTARRCVDLVEGGGHFLGDLNLEAYIMYNVW